RPSSRRSVDAATRVVASWTSRVAGRWRPMPLLPGLPVLLIGIAAVVLTVAPGLRADVSPGETIDKSRLAEVRPLISPSIEWILDRGATMKVAETKPVGWPQAFREATERYAGQVRLAPDGLTLENYIAGQPFPTLDPNDPAMAVKVMLNYEYRPSPGTDDFVAYA